MAEQFAGTIPLEDLARLQIYHNTAGYPEREMEKILQETGGSFLFGGPIFLANLQVCCHLKGDGMTYCAPDYQVWGMAWSRDVQDYGCALLPDGRDNCVECVALIVNGKPVEKPHYNPDMGGSRPRQAMGSKAGRFAYLVTEQAYTPEALRDVLASAGWDSAVMLDGGGSVCYRDRQGRGFACDADRVLPFYLVVHEKEENPLNEKKTVCLDAGHDAGNLANRSPDGTYYEHEFALDMAKRIRTHLERCGVAVTETRPDGQAVSLQERCKIANGIQGLDLFVSLHSNAAASSGWSSAKGWSCYLYGAGGEREKAAQAILKQVKAAGITVRTTALVYDPALYVLKNTAAPAVLIEHAFHTNQEDTENLKSEVWRAKVAQAEAKGIAEYLGVPWAASDGGAVQKPEEPSQEAGDPELSAAVEKLAAAGIIDSPEYWAAGKYSAATVRLLLIKVASAMN